MDELKRIGIAINENELSELNRFKKIVEDPYSTLDWKSVNIQKLIGDFKKLKTMIDDSSSLQG